MPIQLPIQFMNKAMKALKKFEFDPEVQGEMTALIDKRDDLEAFRHFFKNLNFPTWFYAQV